MMNYASIKYVYFRGSLMTAEMVNMRGYCMQHLSFYVHDIVRRRGLRKFQTITFTIRIKYNIS